MHKPYIESQRVKETKRQRVKESKSQREDERKSQREDERKSQREGETKRLRVKETEEASQPGRLYRECPGQRPGIAGGKERLAWKAIRP